MRLLKHKSISKPQIRTKTRAQNPIPSLLAFRDLGPRANRQKARVMYMIEEMGMEAFRETVVSYVQKIDPSFTPLPAAPAPSEAWVRRDIVGVHPQKQEGKSWVCLTTPAGRLTAEEVRGAGGNVSRRLRVGHLD